MGGKHRFYFGGGRFRRRIGEHLAFSVHHRSERRRGVCPDLCSVCPAGRAADYDLRDHGRALGSKRPDRGVWQDRADPRPPDPDGGRSAFSFGRGPSFLPPLRPGGHFDDPLRHLGGEGMADHRLFFRPGADGDPIVLRHGRRLDDRLLLQGTGAFAEFHHPRKGRGGPSVGHRGSPDCGSVPAGVYVPLRGDDLVRSPPWNRAGQQASSPSVVPPAGGPDHPKRDASQLVRGGSFSPAAGLQHTVGRGGFAGRGARVFLAVGRAGAFDRLRQLS